METRGVPTSTIVTTAFLNHARLAAKHLRLDRLPLVVTPHPLNDLTPEQLRELARAAYPLIVEQLTGQGALAQNAHVDYIHPGERNRQRRTEAASSTDTPVSYSQLEAPILEIEDSWKAVNDWFLKHDLTDGLPIVPPTEADVQAMTDYAERTLGWRSSDALGTLAPKGGLATVEKIAANAVMAGCKPEYMPVLIACVQAIADPKFNLDAVQTSTHNTSPLPIVNGPVRNAIDLNWGYNYTGSRWQSTSTIGRALRLIMANVGGTPGSINIHTQGHIARYENCIAENEEENPWEPLHVERGYPPEVSTVTVIPACPAAMIDERGDCQTAKDLLKTLAHSIAYVGNRNINGDGQPLLILCPQHARILGNDGFSKTEVKRFIWEQARVRFGDIPRRNLAGFSEKKLKFYSDFGPDYGIPIADKPEDIVVVVMGGKGTHSLSVQTQLACRNVTVPITRKDGSPWLV